MMSLEQYERMQEDIETGKLLHDLTEILAGRNEGRCSAFLHGFGGKDADLEPHGCTGIVEIVGGNEDHVLVEVAGHKSIGSPLGWGLEPPEGADPDRWDEFLEDLADATAMLLEPTEHSFWEWDGNDAWDAGFRAVIPVPWVYLPNDGENDFEGTADAIILEAEKFCDSVSEAWAAIDRAVDQNYRGAADGTLWRMWSEAKL